MVRIYGSKLCKDCVQCLEDLDKAGVAYEYLDFAENLLHLKTFLHIRETNPLFDEVRRNGAIGIPCILRQDGSVTLDWSEFM